MSAHVALTALHLAGGAVLISIDQSEARLLDFFYGCLIAIGILAFCAVIYMGLGAIVYKFDMKRCHATAAMMQLPSAYSLHTGCMVKVNEVWWPLKSLGL